MARRVLSAAHSAGRSLLTRIAIDRPVDFGWEGCRRSLPGAPPRPSHTSLPKCPSWPVLIRSLGRDCVRWRAVSIGGIFSGAIPIHAISFVSTFVFDHSFGTRGRQFTAVHVCGRLDDDPGSAKHTERAARRCDRSLRSLRSPMATPNLLRSASRFSKADLSKIDAGPSAPANFEKNLHRGLEVAATPCTPEHCAIRRARAGPAVSVHLFTLNPATTAESKTCLPPSILARFDCGLGSIVNKTKRRPKGVAPLVEPG